MFYIYLYIFQNIVLYTLIETYSSDTGFQAKYNITISFIKEN